jgi:hypothetical protein
MLRRSIAGRSWVGGAECGGEAGGVGGDGGVEVCSVVLDGAEGDAERGDGVVAFKDGCGDRAAAQLCSWWSVA